MTTPISWIICILGALFYCYEYLLRIAPAAMVTPLMQTFSLDATSFGLLASLYYVMYTPMQIFAGVAHDMYGPRRVLTFAVFICALGSLVFGLADSLHTASLGRLFLGFGSAFAFIGVLKLASIWLPPNRFALFVGAITALAMAGSVFGNILMVSFVAHVGWRQTYFIGLGVGLLLALLIWLIVRDNPQAKHKNTVGSTTVSHKETLQGLSIIVKSPQMWIVSALGCMLYLSLSVFAELWGNQFVEKAYGFPPLTASTINSMVFIGWLVGAPLMGWLSDRLRRRRLPLILSSILATIVSILMFSFPHYSFWGASALLLLFGFFCSAQVLCCALVRENAPSELTGIAIAFLNLLVTLGSLIFQPILGRFLDYLWNGAIENGIRVYSAHAFKIALLLLPVGCLFAIVFSFMVKETEAKMLGKSLKISPKHSGSQNQDMDLGSAASDMENNGVTPGLPH